MLYNSGKNFLSASAFVLLCLLFPFSCFAENFISRKKIDEIYSEFVKISCFEKYFKENDIYKELSFEAEGPNWDIRKGCLIPLYDCEELKQCYLDTYAEGYADADHMRLYGTGKLRSKCRVIELFKERVGRMWINLPKSLYFGVALSIEGSISCPIVGNVTVGSLVGNDGRDCEVVCALTKKYCGKGIGTAAVKCLMNFVSDLKNKVYPKLKYTQASTRIENTAANKMLNKVGFEWEKGGNGKNFYKYNL